jgi:hypothetical protein
LLETNLIWKQKGTLIAVHLLRLIKKEDGEAVGKENGVIFLEASAKTGDNITQIFEKIGYQVLENEGAGNKQKENEGKMIE